MKYWLENGGGFVIAFCIFMFILFDFVGGMGIFGLPAMAGMALVIGIPLVIYLSFRVISGVADHWY